MRQYNDLKKMMDVAAGRRKASLVLKGGTIVNVFTERTEIGDIAIEDGCIAGIGEYDGLVNVDMTGRYICPGFIDGHIHIESSMVSPPEFEKAVLPHGTTTVITDRQRGRVPGRGLYVKSHGGTVPGCIFCHALLRALHRTGRVRCCAGAGGYKAIL